MPQIIRKENQKNSLKYNGLRIKNQRENEALFHTLQKGSLTVEASLVLPLFLFAAVTVLFLFQALQLQYLAGDALDRAVAETALLREETQEEVNARTKILFYKGLMERNAPVSMVLLGIGGFSWKNSVVNDTYVDMKVTYRIKFPGWILKKHTITAEETSRCRRWVGDRGNSGTGSSQTWVYITPNGRVYHRSRNCTHLKLSIESVFSHSVDLKKYRACERCVTKGEIPVCVYVAKEGECCHARLDCSGLKRTVYMVKLTQAGDKSPCSRCKGE